MLSCHRKRGYICTAPVYAEPELDDAICPWCIADGSAHKNFDATFVDSEAFPDGTPGFNSWQSEQRPLCSGNAMAFLKPAGIAEIRNDYRELEGEFVNHIVHEMKISGGAATRLLQTLNRDAGPTAYLFQQHRFYIDQPMASCPRNLRKQQGRAGALAGSPTPWSGLLKLFRYRRRSSPPVVNYFLDRACVFPSTAGHATSQRIENPRSSADNNRRRKSNQRC